jgi:hypothetical protein
MLSFTVQCVSHLWSSTNDPGIRLLSSCARVITWEMFIPIWCQCWLELTWLGVEFAPTCIDMQNVADLLFHIFNARKSELYPVSLWSERQLNRLGFDFGSFGNDDGSHALAVFDLTKERAVLFPMICHFISAEDCHPEGSMRERDQFKCKHAQWTLRKRAKETKTDITRWNKVSDWNTRTRPPTQRKSYTVGLRHAMWACSRDYHTCISCFD